jgi:hypothetical protein
VEQVFEPGVGLLDLARERFSLLGRRCAAVAAHEKVEAEVGLKLRDGAADMRLADAERGSGLCHPAVAQHGAEQVQVSRIDHA